MSETRTNFTNQDIKPDDRRYYVYRHLRNDTGQPFYVGMGIKPKKIYPSTEYERATSKEDRTFYWHNIVEKHGYTIEIMMDDLTEDEVEAKEIEFIALYGRIENGGILINLTDGGGGRRNFVTSEETKQKLREHNLIPLEEIIRDNVYPCPITGCYHWAGTFYRTPLINYNGDAFSAPKFFYEYYNNVKLPRTTLVRRTCGNLHCVSPLHLRVAPKPTKKGKRGESVEKIKEVFDLKNKGLKPIEISKITGIKYSRVRSGFYSKCWSRIANG